MRWVIDLQSIVFTRVKNGVMTKLQKKYPNINFTTSETARTPPRFPCILIKQMPALEQGRDLEGTGINAVLATFQIDVTDNKSQTRAKEIAFEILRIMKGMGFEVTAMPNFEETEAPYRNTARYRRLTGSGDIL